MNRPIVRLYGLVVLLFALLLAFTSRWTIFEASSLRDNRAQRARLLEQQRIDRGPILAANGTVLARSVRASRRHLHAPLPERRRCSRTRSATPTSNLGQTGIERFRNAALNGQTDTDLQSILDQLQGKKTAQGDEVVTTLDPAAQRVATARSANTRGRSSRSNRAPARSR